MFVEVPRQPKDAASDRFQIMKVERAFLPFGELGNDDGMDGPAHNCCLDERTRIESDHRAAVGTATQSSPPSSAHRPAATRTASHSAGR